MKKFLAIVMCLAMALSMMTVVSFAADLTIGADSVTVAPGEVVSIPVKINADTEVGCAQIEVVIPDEVTLEEVVAGTFPLTEINSLGNIVQVYNENGKSLKADNNLFELKVTAPATAGTYEFTFTDNSMLMDTVEFADMGAVFNAFTLTVKAAETKPTVAATKVDAPEGEDAVCYILQPTGNVTKMGIKCDGYDPFWALADNDGTFATTMAAVQVVGLDDPTIEFAPVYE